MNSDNIEPTAAPWLGPPNRGQTCVHCQRRCGTLAGGFARLGAHPLCSKPTETDRPDCYRMVTTKFHPLHDCPECMDNTPEPIPPRPQASGDVLWL